MSASALLLHRKLIQPGARGWRTPYTSAGEASPMATRAYPLGNVSGAANPPRSQNVNGDSGANPDHAESPQYSPAEDRKLPHA